LLSFRFTAGKFPPQRLPYLDNLWFPVIKPAAESKPEVEGVLKEEQKKRE
jgi:hypothetical protein